ncbi:uncharacterized protein BDZ99DRAFT_472901 [Mytilinidion resinicola]|uniref:Uncharacterized protein n=1 Tax=Mytilinidion resinicola TaxID=574789 RepID=A0A6A6Z0P8_9PEZI|nr:uncharacterized protein BDZ99DRAFT_472901 [Mytilinidion resinicola]KAF2813735.1 hypothetical protein BDZ99DRAFT_472901 [Mytilinidion resinicola]
MAQPNQRTMRIIHFYDALLPVPYDRRLRRPMLAGLNGCSESLNMSSLRNAWNFSLHLPPSIDYANFQHLLSTPEDDEARVVLVTAIPNFTEDGRDYLEFTWHTMTEQSDSLLRESWPVRGEGKKMVLLGPFPHGLLFWMHMNLKPLLLEQDVDKQQYDALAGFYLERLHQLRVAVVGEAEGSILSLAQFGEHSSDQALEKSFAR